METQSRCWSVGRALRDSGVPREEVFLTTKFYPGASDPAAEADPGMERAHERGHARSIGVSNFDVDELAAVIAAADVRPVVNQLQFNPFKYRRALLEACQERGVTLEAYSPLTTGRQLGDSRVAEVARRNDRTPAQVLLRWCVQRGIPTIPKSTRRERLEENAQIFDFELSDEDMAALDALDETGGTARALERKWW
jgi:diketogulonate reductase-like aldo/keto reductase